MSITVKVRDFMNRNIVKVPSTASVREIIEVMVKKDVGSVLVEKNNEIIGIITERDIMKRNCMGPRECDALTASDVMSSPLITIDADASLSEAADLFVKKDIRRLVVTEKGKIVGIFTQKDLLDKTIDVFMVLASV